MSDETLVQLVNDLEWLGCEAGFYSKRSSEVAQEVLLQRQREIVATAEKIERELKGAVRFNLTSLVGVEFPIEWAFESITSLLTELQTIKESCLHSADELPSKVRQFSRMVDMYVRAAVPLVA